MPAAAPAERVWEMPDSVDDFNHRWLSLPSYRDWAAADAAGFAAAARRLDRSVAMLQADPPELDTYENHGLRTTGGALWARFARHGGAPEVYWAPFRDHVHGFLAPAAEMRTVLREGVLVARGDLARSLRFAPALSWRTGGRVEANVEGWQRDMAALLASWPGPLTLVLSGAALGFFERNGRMVQSTPWQAAIDFLTRIEAPQLVGLELSGLPLNKNFFSSLCRAPWFPQLRSLLLDPRDSHPWDLSALFSARPGTLDALVLGEGVADDQLLCAPVFAKLRYLECAHPSFPTQPHVLPSGLETLAVRGVSSEQAWTGMAHVSHALKELFLLDTAPHLVVSPDLLRSLATGGLTTLGLAPRCDPEQAFEVLLEALGSAPLPSTLTALWLPEPSWRLSPASTARLARASLCESRGFRTHYGRWLWAEGDLR